MKARDLIDMMDAMNTREARRQSPLWSAPTSVPTLQSGTGLGEHTFGGFKLIRSAMIPDEAPVLQMHPNCDPLWCTPEFRAKTNAWLLERFGTQPVAYFFTKEQAIAMSHRMAARIEHDINNLCGGLGSAGRRSCSGGEHG
jgi:hypothetical protein